MVTTELQHCFPGCYSVMHDIKSAQRHGEELLVQAEAAAKALAADAAERDAALARIDAAWPDLLFTEFHDILTGTSIPAAWESVRAMQGRARMAGEEMLYDLTRRWSYRTLPRVDAHQVVVLNTDGRPFKGFVEAEPYLDFDDWGDRWISDETGAPVPFQEVQPGSNQMIPRILIETEVPAAGSRQFQVHAGPRPAVAETESGLAASSDALSNGRVSVALRSGGLGVVAVDGVEILDSLRLQLRKDTTDTWTFHTDRWEEQGTATLGGDDWRVEETGPLRVPRPPRRPARDLAGAADRQPLPRRAGAAPRDRGQLRRALHADADADGARRRARALDRRHRRRLHRPRALARRMAVPRLVAGARRRASTSGWSPATATATASTAPSGPRRSCAARGWPGAAAIPGPTPAATSTATRASTASPSPCASAKRSPTPRWRARLAQAAQPLVVFDRYEGMNRPGWGGVPPRGLWGPAMLRNVADGRIEDPGEAPGGLFHRTGEDDDAG